MRHLLACLIIVSAAMPASAQTRTHRRYISVNAAAQTGVGAMTDHFAFDRHAEQGSIDVKYPGKGGVLFDGGAGVRLWRRVGLGVAISRSSSSDTAPISARVPHPLLDSRHRTVEADATDISRTETAAHLQLFYDVPTRGRLRVRLSAGPSVFNLERELVHSIETDETYPYDTATFRRASTGRVKASGPGFNVGGDLSWMFSRRVGAGAMLRYSSASIDLDAEGSRTVSSDAGGFQAGGGLRFVF